MANVPETPNPSVLPQGQYATLGQDTLLKMKPVDTSALDKNLGAMRGIARIQAKKEDEMLELQATDLANQYYRRVTRDMTSENGPLNKHQTDVTEGYNGQAFVEGYMMQYGNWRAQLLETVKDPRVVEKAAKRISAFDNQFANMLATHEGKEAVAAANQINKNAISVAVNSLVTGLNIEGDLATIRTNLRQSADRAGWDMRRPDTQRELERQFREYAGKAASDGVNGFLAQDNFLGARQYVARLNAKKALEGNLVVSLRDKIQQAEDLWKVKTYGGIVVSNMADEDKPSRKVASVFSGNKVFMANLEGFMKDAGLMVPLPGTDKYVAGRVYADGMDRLFQETGSVEGAFTMVAMGADRVNEVLAQMEKDGKEASPGALQEYFTDDERARYNDYMKQFRESDQMTRPKSYADALAMARRLYPNETPEIQRAIAAQAYDSLSTERVVRENENLSTYMNFFQDLQTSGRVDISKYDFSGFTGEQKRKVYKLYSAYQNNLTGMKSPGAMRVYNELWNNPGMLAGMSELDFQLLQADLSNTQFAELQNRRTQLIQGGVPGEVKMSQVNQAIEAACAMNAGLRDLFNDSGKKDLQGIIRNHLWNTLNDYVKQTGGKNGVLQETLNKVAIDQVNSLYKHDKNWVRVDKFLTLGDFANTNVPKKIRRFITTMESLPEGALDDDGTAVAYTLEYMKSPFTGTIPQGAMTLKDRNDIVEAYREASGGREPDEGTVMRIFFLKELGLDNQVDLLTRGTTDRQSARGTATEGLFVNAPEEYEDR